MSQFGVTFMQLEDAIELRWKMFGSQLNERQQRIWAAVEACSLERGGISAVARATGMSRRRVKTGADELQSMGGVVPANLFTSEFPERSAGAGRKTVDSEWPKLSVNLEAVLNGGRLKKVDGGSFMWTTKSIREIAELLTKLHKRAVSPTHISNLLKQLGYSIRRDTRVNPTLPTESQRQAQFQLIFHAIEQAISADQAVLFLSMEKRELRRHERKSFSVDPPVPRYREVKPWISGGYGGDWTAMLAESVEEQERWHLVTPDRHTAALGLQVVGRWWDQEGRRVFGNSGEILLCADGFGEEGDLLDNWIEALGRCHVELGRRIRYCYIPTGIARIAPITNQPTSLLLMQDERGAIGRSKVMLSVLPRYADLQASRLRSSFTVNPKEYKIGRDKEMGQWNFTVG
jgi:hypothetical protein